MILQICLLHITIRPSIWRKQKSRKKSERFIHKAKRCDSWRLQPRVIGHSFCSTNNTPHTESNTHTGSQCNFNFPKKAQKKERKKGKKKCRKTNRIYLRFFFISILTISDHGDRSWGEHVKLAINYLWFILCSARACSVLLLCAGTGNVVVLIHQFIFTRQ